MKNSFKHIFFLLIIIILLGYLFYLLSHKYQTDDYKYQPDNGNLLMSKYPEYLTEVNYLEDFRNQNLFYESYQENELLYVKAKFKSLNQNPDSIRNDILREYILPEDIIKTDSFFVNKSDCYNNYQVYESSLYGIKQRGFLEGNSSNNLLIYFQGHGGNPCDFSYYNRIKEKILESNYDILTFSMFGRGFNQMDTISFPIKVNRESIYDNNYIFNKPNPSGSHDIIRLFYDKENPNIKPLSLMLSSPYTIINKIIGNYENVVITGISGGAWYTTILSGLIPEIDKSYSFNGTLPLLFGIDNNSVGDFEYVYSTLWNERDYYDFYFLSLFNKNNLMNRISYHIYSELDECCFSSPEVIYFKNVIDELNFNNLKVVIFENKVEHNIDDQWLLNKLDL